LSETVLPNHLIHFSETSLLKLPSSLYKTCKTYLNQEDIKKIQKAYSFAFYAHAGQKRKDGSDYITHPVAVTEILLELKMDPDSVCSALMHDVLEDCNVQKADIISARAVADLTTLFELSFKHMSRKTTFIFAKGKSWQEELFVAEKTWNFSWEAVNSITDSQAVVLKIGDLSRAKK
jgi:(p)ppGpp synthase/HD superfamily hydrolase